MRKPYRKIRRDWPSFLVSTWLWFHLNTPAQLTHLSNTIGPQSISTEKDLLRPEIAVKHQRLVILIGMICPKLGCCGMQIHYGLDL